MKIAVFSRDESLMTDPRFVSMAWILNSGPFELYDLKEGEDIKPGTNMVMSVGGDGTFLSAAKRVGKSGIPVLGVNLGRLGFLSEYSPEEVCEALMDGSYRLENRELLDTRIRGDIIE